MNCEHLDLDDDCLDLDDDFLDLYDDLLDLDDDLLDLDDDCLDLDDDCLHLDNNLCGVAKAKWRNFIPINPLSFTPSPLFVFPLSSLRKSTTMCNCIYTYIHVYT